MLTPNVAAAFVTGVAGALFVWFALSPGFVLLVLSFFVCVVLFFGNSFAALPKYQQFVYYALNSLIVFGMATVAHIALDAKTTAPRTPRGAAQDAQPATGPQSNGAAILFPRVYAQEGAAVAGADGIAVIEQTRPFFVDWLQSLPESASVELDEPSPIHITVCRTFGEFTDRLARWGRSKTRLRNCSVNRRDRC